jgi:hypothetical protein
MDKVVYVLQHSYKNQGDRGWHDTYTWYGDKEFFFKNDILTALFDNGMKLPEFDSDKMKLRIVERDIYENEV